MAANDGASGYLNLGIGPELTLKIYHAENGTVNEIDPLIYSGYGGSISLSGGYMFNPYIGLGLKSGLNYNTSELVASDGTFTIPLMLEMMVRPKIGIVNFPLRLALGGFAQIAGNKIAFGPAAEASLGLACDVTENVSIGYYTTASLFTQLYEGAKNVSYQVNLTLFTLAMTVYI